MPESILLDQQEDWENQNIDEPPNSNSNSNDEKSRTGFFSVSTKYW
jgi:hypothetical protein